MATISRSFGTLAQIVGTGDAYVTLSGTTESYSSDVDLETNGYEGAHVVAEVNFDASNTDHVDVYAYGSLNGTDFDDSPFASFRIDKSIPSASAGGLHQVSFILRDLAHFRIGFKQTGSTNSHDVRAYVQPWRWTSV